MKRVGYEKRKQSQTALIKVSDNSFCAARVVKIQLGRSTQTVAKYRELGKKIVVIKERRTAKNN